MDFYSQLAGGYASELSYDQVREAKGLKARIYKKYMDIFNGRLAPLKVLATVNGMPVFDLTQPPLWSEANQRVLETGAGYTLLGRAARPITAVLALTHACDCDCQHCSARDYMRGGRKAMSYDQLCDVIDQALALGVASFVFTGGEPTLHPRLLELVARVPASQASVCLFTNGARIDASYARELRRAGLFAALVSIDAPEAAQHDELRRKSGAFDQAMRAIDSLHQAGSLVGISSYMTHQRLAEGQLDAMLRLAADRSVHQLFLFDAVPSGAMRGHQDWMLTDADRKLLKQRAVEINATPGGFGMMGQAWINSPDGFGCFAGFYQCYISASGDVCPCDFTPVSFGNVREEPLEAVWQRMRGSEEWGRRSSHCRMQDACFRARTVELLPPGTPLPVSYEEILRLRARAALPATTTCSERAAAGM